ncbi:MAG: AAA family ATPase [Leptospiraceae bacterium]|nr:AAA family ATPase [Leptospiraceae bacterium]
MVLSVNTARQLSAYLPLGIVRELTQEGLQRLRRHIACEGVVLFVDVAGFTPLSREMADRGQRGNEVMMEVMTDYYSVLISHVRRSGGNVFQFAGDSILVGFARNENETPQKCLWRVATTALNIQNDLQRFDRLRLLDIDCSIQSKIGLAYGDYIQYLLGSFRHYYRAVIAGPPAIQAVRAQALARGGQILLPVSSAEMLPGTAQWQPLSNTESVNVEQGHLNEEYAVSSDFALLTAVPGAEIPESIAESNIDFAREEYFFRAASRFLDPELFKKFTTGHLSFFGAHREVTVLLIRLDGMRYDRDTLHNLENFNRLHNHVLGECRKFGGVLIQVDLTDKGSVLFVLFGAPNALVNKEILSVRMALRMLQQVRENADFAFVRRLRMGITTGPAYCGDLGAPFRKGYTVLGDQVNFATRLMSYGEHNGIHIDELTAERLNEVFDLQELRGVDFKGVAASRTIYAVDPHQNDRPALRTAAVQDAMVGRETEFEKLLNLFKDGLRSTSRVAALSGDMGVGKSRLVFALTEQLRYYNARLCAGVCFSYERNTPLHAWRNVLLDLFEIQEHDSEEERLARIETALRYIGPDQSDREAALVWAPVIGELLGLRLEEHAATRNLESRIKHDLLFGIILSLIQHAARSRMLLMIIDDAHWMDDLSTELFLYLARRLHATPVFILLIMRPAELTGLLRHEKNIDLLELGRMTLSESRRFLSAKLKVERIDPELEEFILQRADGNPFFIDAIIKNLEEERVLVRQGRQFVRLSAPIERLHVPATLKEAIMARIDRLDENEQAILKTATIIGQRFDRTTLGAIIPPIIEPDMLDAGLRSLANQNLLEATDREGEGYAFAHTLIRDIAYDSILVSTREALHLWLAEYLERRSLESRLAWAESLSYHFMAGNHAEKGFGYALLAAMKANEQFANRDAIHFYRQSLEFLKQSQEPADKELLFQVHQDLGTVYRQAGMYEQAILEFEHCLRSEQRGVSRLELYRGLGQAYQERGEIQVATRHLETALRLSGLRIPHSVHTILPGIIKNMCLRGVYTLIPVLRRWRRKPHSMTYRRQCSILRILFKVHYYWSNLGFVWGVLTAVNLAEQSGSRFEMSMAYSSYALLLSRVRFFRWRGRYYYKAAEQLARRNGDPISRAYNLQMRALDALQADDYLTTVRLARQQDQILREVGEVWDSILARGLYSTACFLLGDYRRTLSSLNELLELTVRQKARMHHEIARLLHIGCRYMLDELSGREVNQELLSLRDRVMASENHLGRQLCLALLTTVAVREGRVLDAAHFAVLTHATVQHRQMLMARTAWNNAADGALFALEHREQLVDGDVRRLKELEEIARQGFKRAHAAGRHSAIARGQAYRLQARYAAYQGGHARARRLFQKAIRSLERQRSGRRELCAVLLDRARLYPEFLTQDETKLRRMLTEADARLDLRRLDMMIEAR